MEYSLTKYKGKWSVFSATSRCYFFIGCGKRFCVKKMNELNELNKPIIEEA